MSDGPDLVIEFAGKPHLGGYGEFQEFGVVISNHSNAALTDFILGAQQGKIRFERSARQLAARGKSLQDLHKNHLAPGERWQVDFQASNIQRLTGGQVSQEAEQPLLFAIEGGYGGARLGFAWKMEADLGTKLAERFNFSRAGEWQVGPTGTPQKGTIPGWISRLEDIGLGVVASGLGSYPFSFDKIERYSGEDVGSLPMQEGDQVVIEMEGGKILRIRRL